MATTPIPGDLLDGGFTGTPNLAFYNPNGTWDVENHGVPPDIEVEYDPQAVRAGHDPQLEKAVEVVMDLLKKNPPPPDAATSALSELPKERSALARAHEAALACLRISTVKKSRGQLSELSEA